MDSSSSAAPPQYAPYVQDRRPGNGAYCATGPSPYLVMGAVLWTLRQHFVDRSSIAAPRLRDIANPDPATLPPPPEALDRIVIVPIDLFSPELCGRSPAIVVRDDDSNFETTGIGDRHDGAPTTDGARYYATMHVGSVTTLACAQNRTVARELGREVYTCLLGAVPVLRSAMVLKRLRVTHATAPARVREIAGYGVAVTTMFAYTEERSLRPQAPVIKRLTVGS